MAPSRSFKLAPRSSSGVARVATLFEATAPLGDGGRDASGDDGGDTTEDRSVDVRLSEDVRFKRRMLVTLERKALHSLGTRPLLRRALR